MVTMLVSSLYMEMVLMTRRPANRSAPTSSATMTSPTMTSATMTQPAHESAAGVVAPQTTKPRGAPDESAMFRTADGTTLHVTETGPADAAATLVLVHGWTQDNRTWDPVRDELQQR